MCSVYGEGIDRKCRYDGKGMEDVERVRRGYGDCIYRGVYR